jgi:hypothetical protein
MMKNIENDLIKLKKDAKKFNKKLAIVITVTTQQSNWKIKILPVRILEKIICLPIGIKNSKKALEIIKKYDGFVDIFFIDIENKISECQNLLQKVKKNIKKSEIYPIKGNDFSADASYATILEIFKDITNKKFCIIGAGNIGSKVALKLIESGSNVFIINSNYKSSIKTATAINTLKPKQCMQSVKPISISKIPEEIDGVIGFTRGIPVITSNVIKKIKKGGIVFDGGTGTITDEAIINAKKKKLKVLRLDMRSGFESNVTLMMNTRILVSGVIGIKKIKGFNIISGGYIGNLGDIVVDDFKNPKKILGISNGKGGLTDNPIKEKISLNDIKNWGK